TLAQGTTARFTSIKPAILTVSPYNGSSSVYIDSPVVVRFNMPMNHAATESAFVLGKASGGRPIPVPTGATPGSGGGGAPNLSGSSAVQGTFQWSADSTVMTFTAASLLDFGTGYVAGFGKAVQPEQGATSELSGGPTVNTWGFYTTETTHVVNHTPTNDT